MKKNNLITLLLIIFLIIAVVFLFPKGKNGSLVSPAGNLLQEKSTSQEEVINYNPPKEVKYDSSTDLEKELEGVDPKVLEADFQSLKDL